MCGVLWIVASELLGGLVMDDAIFINGLFVLCFVLRLSPWNILSLWGHLVVFSWLRVDKGEEYMADRIDNW